MIIYNFMNEDLKNQIWEKAFVSEGFDPNLIRKDCCGALILKSEFGNYNSKFGWVIDHVFPVSRGGDDNIKNLRPMQWENNTSKGNDFPVYHATVKAENNDNIHYNSQFKVNDKLAEWLKNKYELGNED